MSEATSDVKQACEVEGDWTAATLRQARRREAERCDAAARRAREIGANYLASRLDAEAKRLRKAAGSREPARLDPPAESA